MKKIQLWSIGSNPSGRPDVQPVESVANSETEKTLEDLLVASPEILMEGLTLVGRQVQTGGGPLDLLGIDSDGRVVVFELKRGVLTRDAVAQVVDYASDLATQGVEGLSRWVEASSGRLGIERIEDFADWYGQAFTSNDDALDEPPRMVLVGLGVDDRAHRMVEFLARSGVDIRLLTFHAFQADGKLFLARQVETRVPPRTPRVGETKESNRRILRESAAGLGVLDLLEEIADFIDARMPSAYRWAGKTAYSFSLPEKTSEGKPSNRWYIAVYLVPKQRGSLNLQLAPRADRVASEALDAFCAAVPSAERTDKSYSSLEALLTGKTWPEAKGHLDSLVRGIVAGWEKGKLEEESGADLGG